MRHGISNVGAMLALSLLALTGSAHGQSTFQGLGQFPGSDGHVVFEVSGNGSTIVGSLLYPGLDRAFYWTKATGIVNLGAMPGGAGGSTGAFDLSFDGSVIVGAGVGAMAAWEAFRWTQATGMVGLGDLPGGPFYSVAQGCSSNGAILFGQGDYGYPPPTGQAFRWTQATGMVAIGDLPGGAVYGDLLHSSDDGSILVGYGSTPTGFQMTRWTQATGLIGLGDLPGGIEDSGALGCSADGSVIVGWASDDEGYQAVRWTSGGGFQKLGKLPGSPFSSDDFALNCSADGSIIVGAVKVLFDDPAGFGHGRAFIWDAVHGMRDLRDVLIFEHGLTALNGWQLTIGSSITADGKTVIGQGFNPQGKYEGWIATLDASNPGPCYADCDGDGSLTIDDFICFQTYFAIGC
jgi:hypothetical protein